MEQTRQQDAERGKKFLKSLDERIERGGYGAIDLQSLREGIGDTHKTVSDRDHAEAIGRDIRTGQGFTKWPHAQHLVGDLIQPKAERWPSPKPDIHAPSEPMHGYQRSGAAAGASYKPESQRGMVDFVEGRIFQQRGLSEALGRGAILSKAPEEPRPARTKSLVQQFVEKREIKQYDKESDRVAEFMTRDIPASVKARNDELREKAREAREDSTGRGD